MSVAVTRTELLTGVVERTEHARDSLERIADRIHDRERDVFRTANNGRWAVLDPATVQAKGSARVLVGNGDLLASLTRSGARGAVTIATDDRLVVGTNLVQGLMAAQGARGAPERNPVPPPTQAEMRDWAGDLMHDIVRAHA